MNDQQTTVPMSTDMLTGKDDSRANNAPAVEARQSDLSWVVNSHCERAAIHVFSVV